MPSIVPEALPASIDHPDMRHAQADLLSLALMDARNHTLHLLAQYEQAGASGLPPVPPHAELELPHWLAGHVAWLAEYWISRNPQHAAGRAGAAGGMRLASIEPMADGWFDPSLADHATRWQLPLPDGAGVRAYLLDTLETTLELLGKAAADDDALHFFRAVLFHEDLRGEQLVTQAQTLGMPLQLALPAGAPVRPPIGVTGGRWMLGSAGRGFAFDLELPAHAVVVPDFEIDAQPVNWAQFVEFVDDGGYDRPELWAPEGWRWLQREAQGEGRRSPRHVTQIGEAGGAVMQAVFGRTTRMAGNQCAMHLCAWEADAWARWAGRRLPTEAEWDMAAQHAARRGFRWGDVREWTATTLRPWDGFAADAWTRGTPWEAAPLFGSARVQRGASFATRARMKHPRLRSFALPSRDDGFFGFRTCTV